MSALRAVRPAGEHAVLLDLADDLPPPAAAAALHEACPGDLVEAVPGHRTVLAVFTAAPPASDVLAAALVRATDAGPPSPDEGEPFALPVTYDGEDLDALASELGLSREALVERHREPVYAIAFVGTGGFPYLTGGDPRVVDVPRRDEPRTRVPAGAVAVAAGYTGVYPSDSPGGWWLLGHTDANLFDPARDPPALLRAGQRVRLRAVDEPRAAAPRAAAVLPGPSEHATPSISLEILKPGPSTTVQDLGRPGLLHLGVPRGGAADRPAARLANRLVGNDDHAALLEVTLGGLRLRFDAPTTIALTGAPAPARRADGEPVPHGVPVGVEKGEELTLATPRSGLRTYLALRGGIDDEPVLGSRAHDALLGLARPPLRAGDRLAIASPNAPLERLPPAADRAATSTLAISLGPREDHLSPQARAALTGKPFAVTPKLDRVGIRLTGPTLRWRSPQQLPSEPMLAGAVQVPPSGDPIVLLADHPTMGGYPVVAVLTDEALAAAAQLRPGEEVRFEERSR